MRLLDGLQISTDGSLKPGARRGVIMQRLDLRRARLRQRRFRIEHVQLRAGAGLGTRASSCTFRRR